MRKGKNAGNHPFGPFLYNSDRHWSVLLQLRFILGLLLQFRSILGLLLQFRSLLGLFLQFRSILVTSFTILIHIGPFFYNSDPYLAFFYNSYPYWAFFYNSDPYWSLLLQFRSILVPSFTIQIHIELSFIIQIYIGPFFYTSDPYWSLLLQFRSILGLL